jgi:hypothetical protein
MSLVLLTEVSAKGGSTVPVLGLVSLELHVSSLVKFKDWKIQFQNCNCQICDDGLVLFSNLGHPT